MESSREFLNTVTGSHDQVLCAIDCCFVLKQIHGDWYAHRQAISRPDPKLCKGHFRFRVPANIFVDIHACVCLQGASKWTQDPEQLKVSPKVAQHWCRLLGSIQAHGVPLLLIFILPSGAITTGVFCHHQVVVGVGC